MIIEAGESINLNIVPTKNSSLFYIPDTVNRNFRYWLRECLLSRDFYINQLVDGINENLKFQTLKGVTGSGKTFTIANVIEKVNKPTLVLAHNKTLAAQLYSEFKEYFPSNSVEYFSV